MKRILCYGDSNTFGYRPDGLGQYDEKTRWTGLLAKALGEDFCVIENGVCGRTNALDDPRADGRNGLSTIESIMDKYSPIDLVILMLGTNDLKSFYGMTAKSIAQDCERVIEKILLPQYSINKPPKILLVSPILLGENILSIKSYYDETSIKVSRLISTEYEALARDRNYYFMRAEDFAEPSPIDCEHMDEIGHKNLAAALENAVKEIDFNV